VSAAYRVAGPVPVAPKSAGDAAINQDFGVFW
jgi:hypothetical protein